MTVNEILSKMLNVFPSDIVNNAKSTSNSNIFYIKNNQNNKALELYDNNHYLTDDIMHVLAIKACANIAEKEGGYNYQY